jgi:hypothetical protein
VVEQDPQLAKDLLNLVNPVTRGDPQSPLLWTAKSTRRLARELRRQGHDVSHQTVATEQTTSEQTTSASVWQNSEALATIDRCYVHLQRI